MDSINPDDLTPDDWEQIEEAIERQQRIKAIIAAAQPAAAAIKQKALGQAIRQAVKRKRGQQQ